MNTTDNNPEIALSAKDRHILEEIGFKSIFQTKKGLIIRHKKDLIGNIKSQWQDHQTP